MGLKLSHSNQDGSLKQTQHPLVATHCSKTTFGSPLLTYRLRHPPQIYFNRAREFLGEPLLHSPALNLWRQIGNKKVKEFQWKGFSIQASEGNFFCWWGWSPPPSFTGIFLFTHLYLCFFTQLRVITAFSLEHNFPFFYFYPHNHPPFGVDWDETALTGPWSPNKLPWQSRASALGLLDPSAITVTPHWCVPILVCGYYSYRIIKKNGWLNCQLKLQTPAFKKRSFLFTPKCNRRPCCFLHKEQFLQPQREPRQARKWATQNPTE